MTTTEIYKGLPDQGDTCTSIFLFAAFYCFTPPSFMRFYMSLEVDAEA